MYQKLLILLLIYSTFAQADKPGKGIVTKGEIIYHIFQRSFYDTNGDLHGDLNGVTEKLDYLQELGVTSVLFTPLYKSVYYHNYFADDFDKIDQEYGTMQDYLNLVKQVHKRGMKIYLDMETQYVTADHIWYKDSYGNPKSIYSKYIIYNDSANLKPEPIIFDLTELKGYNGETRKVATVNLYNKDVQEYNFKLFKYWIDPNSDGTFDDGVDGFRLDHMMDNLDWKTKLTGLFDKFWNPMLSRLRQVNPNIRIVAEQAEWRSFGFDYMAKGGVDRVFAFRVQQAIASFNKKKLIDMADSTFSLTPENKQQVVFIENHDMMRFSNAVNHDPEKLKIGAILNLLLGGVPSIYYGQELGMKGAGGFGKYGNTDANDIPEREAFEWNKDDAGKGMALWYKNTGPWWYSTNVKANDGISLEEEKKDPKSLWNFYKTIIQLRQANASFQFGKYQTLNNKNESVFSFLRIYKDETSIVLINLSDKEQQVVVDLPLNHIHSNNKNIIQLLGTRKPEITNSDFSVQLPAYETGIWHIK